MMMNSVWAKGAQIGIYSLFGADYFNYCIVFGLSLIISRKRQHVPKCLLIRDFFLTSLTLVILFMYIRDNGTLLWLFVTWGSYIFNVTVDRNNEAIMTKIFKFFGLIEEDESFDAGPLTRMRKRRFTEEFFIDIVEKVKQKKELIHAIKKQDYLYSISYENEKGRERKIENFKKFSRLIFIVIFCIREKTQDAIMLRDLEFARRSGPLENFETKHADSLSDSNDNDDDEVSFEKIKGARSGRYSKFNQCKQP